MKDSKVVSREVTVGWTEAPGSQGSEWKEQALHSAYIDPQLARCMSSQMLDRLLSHSPSRAVTNVSHSSVVAQTIRLVTESTLSTSYSRRLFLPALD